MTVIREKARALLCVLGRFIASLVETPYEGPVKYGIRHIKRIIAAILISTIPTLYLVSNTFMVISRNYKGVISDITGSDEFVNAAWGTLFIYLPILIGVYTAMCFAGDIKKEGKYTVYTSCTLFLGILASAAILSHGHDEVYGAVNMYLTTNKASCYFQFFASVVIITYSCSWMKLNAFIRRGGAYEHPWFVKTGMCLFSSIMAFVLLEVQIGSHLNVDAGMLFFDIIYWIIAWMFLYAIFRSIRITSVLCVIAGWSIGVANFCVLQFRGN